MMLEVPAAAISINDMLPHVDFVSIGSNDLVQYLMAADRDNPKVSHLCQPLAPPVLKTLATVIKACRKANKPVTLCGEMAGQPRAFVLLFAMGLRSFSMSPAFIPSMKELAAHLTEEIARRILPQSAYPPHDDRRQALHGRAAQPHRPEPADARYGLSKKSPLLRPPPHQTACSPAAHPAAA